MMERIFYFEVEQTHVVATAYEILAEHADATALLRVGEGQAIATAHPGDDVVEVLDWPDGWGANGFDPSWFKDVAIWMEDKKDA